MSIWRLWSYALGRKEGRNDKEANIIASIRTLVFVSYLITNGFIISGVVRHWNNRPLDLADQPLPYYNNKVNKQSNVCHH